MTFIAAARWLFAALLLIVTWLVLTPNPQDTEAGMDFARWLARLLFGNPELGDKVAHVLAFASLGASAALGRIRIAGSGVLTVAALALYGAVLEIGQLIGGVRDAELMDAAADAFGAVLGYTGLVLFLNVAMKNAQA